MEKIATIKRLQGFMIVFLVGILLNTIITIVSGFLGVNLPSFLGLILSLVNFSAYILLWVGFAQSKDILPTRKKYLLLALLVTILTIIIVVGSYVAGAAMTMQALNDGIITATMDVETMTAALAGVPAITLVGLLSNAATIIVNVIYLGLGYVIFSQNKQELANAETEYQNAYGEQN